MITFRVLETHDNYSSRFKFKILTANKLERLKVDSLRVIIINSLKYYLLHYSSEILYQAKIAFIFQKQLSQMIQPFDCTFGEDPTGFCVCYD